MKTIQLEDHEAERLKRFIKKRIKLMKSFKFNGIGYVLREPEEIKADAEAKKRNDQAIVEYTAILKKLEA